MHLPHKKALDSPLLGKLIFNELSGNGYIAILKSF